MLARHEAVAQNIDDVTAREVALPRAEDRRHAAAEAVSDQRNVVARADRESELAREALQKTHVIGIERACDDSDFARRHPAVEQLTHSAADRAQLGFLVRVLFDRSLGRLDVEDSRPRLSRKILHEARSKSVSSVLADRHKNRCHFFGGDQRIHQPQLRASHVVEPRENLLWNGRLSDQDSGALENVCRIYSR